MRVSHGVICNRATEDHVSTIANNIAITTSEKDDHCALSVSGTESNNHAACGYNLVTRIQSQFTVASNDGTSYTPVSKTTFGFGDWSNDNYMSFCTWNGDLSTSVPTFNKCSLSDVESLIKANTAIGADFWNYLTTTTTTSGDKLSEVDIRGIKRSSPIWPGCYQQD